MIVFIAGIVYVYIISILIVCNDLIQVYGLGQIVG